MKTKVCSRCGETMTLGHFSPRKGGAPGARLSQCKECRAEVSRAKTKTDAETRLASDHEPLTLEDLDLGVGNDAGAPSRERRQEYSKRMGETAKALRASQGDPERLDETTGRYVGGLAEQEGRFGNRRLYRSVSLAMAQEELALKRFAQVARELLAGKVKATGFGTRRPAKPAKRSVCQLLTDLHIRSDISALDNPVPQGAVEESRKLEKMLRELVDYKPQYRANSRAVLLFGGDIIEGALMHDFRDGAPLAEQKAAALMYLSRYIAEASRAYPEVHCEWQPGNHGRDKVRHPGRATSRKWDGHEWEIGFALREMTRNLQNVTWSLPFRAVSIIEMHGQYLGLSHGDTEIKLGDPDTKAMANAAILDKINSTRIYGVEFAGWCFGHFHKARFHARQPKVLYNGPLVPPNGYARTAGYIGEECGQWMFEAVEGHIIGDLRFVSLGPDVARDERLGEIIRPFSF